jgi:phage terminase small subunit
MRGSRTQTPNRTVTNKQRRFIAEYLVDSNATQAAIRAGFSKKTAYSIGSRLLKNVEVSYEIARRQRALERHLEVSAQGVLAEYAKVAGTRITDYLAFGPDGVVMRDCHDIPDRQLDAVQEVTERVGAGGVRTVSLKLHSKLDALGALGKHLGLFVERHEHDISDRLSETLDRIAAHLSDSAQEELERAVGTVLATTVAHKAVEPAREPSG